MRQPPQIPQLARELEAMPEYQALTRLRSLEPSVHVFQGNAEDLIDALSAHVDSDTVLERFHMGNRKDLHVDQIEIARFLHNFVAAAASIVEHTDKLYTETYLPKALFSDYQTEVRRRTQAPHIQFVRCLRNYFLHVGVPPITSKLSFTAGGPLAVQVLVATGPLSQAKDWNAAARKFLATCGDYVDLREVVRQYVEEVGTFLQWFQGRLLEIHSDDIRKVSEKRDELRAAHFAELPRRVDIALDILGKGFGQPEDVLQQMVPHEWERIRRLPTLAEQCEEVLRVAEAHVALDEATTVRLRAACAVNPGESVEADAGRKSPAGDSDP